MSFRRSSITFAILMTIGLLSYRVAWDGLYPLVFVNYSFITGDEVDRNLSLAYDYYRNALTYSGSDPSKLDVPDSYNELKRAVIDEMISREIIMNELKSRVSSREIDEISEKNISAALKEAPQIADGINKLYGLSLADFKEQILIPQARKEILEGRMNLSSQDFNAWLGKARRESWILILSQDFVWDGAKVVLK